MIQQQLFVSVTLIQLMIWRILKILILKTMKTSRNNTDLLDKNVDNNNLSSSLPATIEIQNETKESRSKTIRSLIAVVTTLVKPPSAEHDGQPSDAKTLIFSSNMMADHNLAAVAKVINLLRPYVLRSAKSQNPYTHKYAYAMLFHSSG